MLWLCIEVDVQISNEIINRWSIILPELNSADLYNSTVFLHQL